MPADLRLCARSRLRVPVPSEQPGTGHVELPGHVEAPGPGRLHKPQRAPHRREINGAGDAVSVVEQTLGTYGAVWSSSTLQRGVYGDHGQQGQNSGRVSLAYVTGAHSFKSGVQMFTGSNNIGGPDVTNNQPYQYILRNGVPVGLNLAAYPHHHVAKVKMDLGLYVQDQWTMNRWTVNGGLRFDYLNGYNPAQCRPAGDFTPEFCFDELKNVPNWKDISPRVGVAYDLFGNAKTALKVICGPLRKARSHRHRESDKRRERDCLGNVPDVDRQRRFRARIATSRTRLTNGECGAYDNRLFGTKTATTAFADDVKEGFGIRQYNWQTAVSVQHELRPGFGVTVGYFNTWWGNGGSDTYPGGGGDWVTDNLLVVPGDFTTSAPQRRSTRGCPTAAAISCAISTMCHPRSSARSTTW